MSKNYERQSRRAVQKRLKNEEKLMRPKTQLCKFACKQNDQSVVGITMTQKLIFVINQSLQRKRSTQKKGEHAKCLPQLEEADTTAARREQTRKNTLSGEEWNMPPRIKSKDIQFNIR